MSYFEYAGFFLIYALDQTIVLTIQKILRAVTTISSIQQK